MAVSSRILGIDPSLTNTGWGIIEVRGNNLKYVCCGTIKTTTKNKMPLRLAIIYNELFKVFKENNIDECSIEEVFVNKNPSTSLKLGQARGVAMVVPSQFGIDVFEYQNRMIKRTLTGSGSADKQQISKMLSILLPSAKPDSEHSADALAIAITHSQMRLNLGLNNKG